MGLGDEGREYPTEIITKGKSAAYGTGHADILPEADHVRLVRDNPDIRGAASFREAFPPGEAGKPVKRPGIRHTPGHGSLPDG